MEQSSDKVIQYAYRILEMAKQTILMRFRYFDRALAKYRFRAMPASLCYEADGEVFSFDPQRLCKEYVEEPGIATRLLLHVLLHGIFLHSFRGETMQEDVWNLACDIAVEHLIMEMHFTPAEMAKDEEVRDQLAKLEKWIPHFSADRIYRECMAAGLSADTKAMFARIFAMDTHPSMHAMKEKSEFLLTEEDWKKISRRVKTEIKAFSEEEEGDAQLLDALVSETKPRADYKEILRRFAVYNEEILVNPQEYDYIYYTYGLKTYGNMPLIEPLEYVEDKRISDFVIAIDTSASCKGDSIRHFLEETMAVLSETESFTRHVNVHIVECDAMVREDVLVHSKEELQAYVASHSMKGFGATDYRPVFSHIEAMQAEGKLKNLRGVIYFTDGYGIYPQERPSFEVIFVFWKEDGARPQAPAWAYTVERYNG